MRKAQGPAELLAGALGTRSGKTAAEFDHARFGPIALPAAGTGNEGAMAAGFRSDDFEYEGSRQFGEKGTLRRARRDRLWK